MNEFICNHTLKLRTLAGMDLKVISFGVILLTSLVRSFEMPNVEFIKTFAETNDRDNLNFHFSEEFSQEVFQWHKSQYKRFTN